MVVYRELTWRDLIDCAGNTAVVTGQIIIIVACANIFSFFLTVNQVPAYLVAILNSWELAPWMILLMIKLAPALGTASSYRAAAVEGIRHLPGILCGADDDLALTHRGNSAINAA